MQADFIADLQKVVVYVLMRENGRNTSGQDTADICIIPIIR